MNYSVIVRNLEKIISLENENAMTMIEVFKRFADANCFFTFNFHSKRRTISELIFLCFFANIDGFSGGSVVRMHLEPHAEVLLALNKTCLEWTSQWLRLALADATAPLSTEAQKHKFLREVLKEQTSKWRLCAVIKEFSLQCQCVKQL